MTFKVLEHGGGELQSSSTTLRIRRILVHIRMHTTSVDAIRQNVIKIRPSVWRLAGLMKLDCIPGGGSMRGSFNISDTVCVIVRFVDVYGDYGWKKVLYDASNDPVWRKWTKPIRSSRAGTFSIFRTSHIIWIIQAPRTKNLRRGLAYAV